MKLPMAMIKPLHPLGFAIFLLAHPLGAMESLEFTQSVEKVLLGNVADENRGVVVGIVDEHGSTIVSYGKLGNGTDQHVDGETLFEIGSITKTFTVLLLQDMVARGQMNLDDPVAKYLPATVKTPSRNGKQITLLHLATHMSGLPRDDTYFSHSTAWSDKVVAAYTMDNMYDFLSKHQLRRDPGLEFEYSNVGMALLAHAIALKAGTTYESLVMERICRPLKMDSTCFAITPELKPRLATGHDGSGKETPGWELDGYMGAGGLRSSVNDLLKYVSANMGLAHSTLTPLMEKAHVIRHRDAPGYGDTAMTWMDRGKSEETSRRLLGHAGGTGGYEAFIGFDKEHRRGVTVLSNKVGGQISERLGWFLLEDVPLTAEIAAGFSALGTNSVVGVGLGIKRDQPTHTLRTISVLPNSPASKAGLTIGLTIVRIGDVATAGKSIEHCTSLIRGQAGTPVRLELIDAAGKRRSVELTREKVLFPDEKKG